MTLTLSALSLNDQPLSQPVVAHFDDQGGTIGRGDQNTLALPDPERHISRQHARITAEAKGYRITNLSSANAVTVAGRTLGQGESAPIRHRDQVRIGGFLLEARDDSADDLLARTITGGRAATAATADKSGGVRPGGVAGGGPPPIAAPSPEADPFADFFGPAVVRPAAPRQGAPGPAVAPAADPFAGFTGFGAPAPAPVASHGRPGAASAGSLAGFSGLGEPGGSIDDLLGPGLGAGAGTGADLDAFLRQPVGAPDAAAAPAAAAPARPSAGASQPDHVPALQAAFKAPVWPEPAPEPVTAPTPLLAPTPASARPPAPPPTFAPAFAPATPRPPAPAVAAVAAGATPSPRGPSPAWADADDPSAALWRAFCEGADLHLQLPQGLSPELMRVIGQLLRSAVDGTQQMMAIRAATKHELRADVTMIQARQNNPLKFSPDAQAALEQLLQPPMRGFLPGPAAMTDAMHDLVGHTIGTMAGMRAALEGVLNRFAPTVLEGKLTTSSVLDTLLPMNRRSRLWELYLQHFEGIRQEAQEDFHTLFGRAFLAAYEQQLDRLHAQHAEHDRQRPAAPSASSPSSSPPSSPP